MYLVWWPKCEFSLEKSSLNVGCVFSYFCGGRKNSFPLWFRNSFRLLEYKVYYMFGGVKLIYLLMDCETSH